MSAIDLATLQVTDLDVFVNPCDLRKDLHIFMGYLREHEVKRSVRGNRLPKSDALRLAKSMTDPGAAEEVERDGESIWIDYVDQTARLLKLTQYNTKGVYAGYTSATETFPDNFMGFEEEHYRKFLKLPLQAQEERILAALLEDFDHSNNEFFARGPKSRQDGFDTRGCATGVMPTLQFDKIRRALLRLLAEHRSGVWYSVAALVADLKTKRPFFLIPEKIPDSVKYDRRRYHNFAEGNPKKWGSRVEISETSPNAFDRVEGRFVERFLEGIPLTLGYVDVAYVKNPAANVSPSLHVLRAFRLTERFLLAMQGAIPEPKVTVLPNFEIHVDSPIYPASILGQVSRFGDMVVEDVHSIIRLTRDKVAAFAAENKKANPADVLQALTAKPLPPNVEKELREWVGHSERFTLYDGFGLLEIAEEETTQSLRIADFVTEQIRAGMYIVRSPDKLFERLEEAERVPIRLSHGSRLSAAPPWSVSAFRSAPKSAKPAVEEKPATLKRRVRIILEFPSQHLLQAFSKALTEAGCAFIADAQALTVTFAPGNEEIVRATLRAFQRKHRVAVEDIK